MECLGRIRPKRKRRVDTDLETAEQQKERWRSIYVVYFNMFLMSLGFSIVLTGVWPYLEMLDSSAGKQFMGYVVAANPLGQMLFSPFVGWWGNKRGSVRLPLLVTLALFVGSSAVYSALQIIPGSAKTWMIVARFGVGVSSANIALTRSYLSAATTVSERTNAVSMVSLAQVLGFVVGPALQAAVTPLGKKGYTVMGLPINMYTAAGWINVLLGVMNFILFLPRYFKERRIAGREAMRDHGKASEKEVWEALKPDRLAAWSLISAYGILVFNFVLLETLGTPLTLDNFAWTRKQSLWYMGLLMSIGALVACVAFLLIGSLSKRFGERRVMIFGGFVIMLVGRIIMMPYGSVTPIIANSNSTTSSLAAVNSTEMLEPPDITNSSAIINGTEIFEWPEMSNTSVTNNGTAILGSPAISNTSLTVNDTEEVGCPSTQKWCYYVPAMTPEQFVIGYGFTTIGYPVGVTLTQTIFSKILGPRPQGVWMGMLTGAGCVSRILGPIFVGHIYTTFGTYHTFGITGFTLIIGIVWLLSVDKRLIPKVAESQSPKEINQNGHAIDAELPLFTKREDSPKEIEMQTLNDASARDKD